MDQSVFLEEYKLTGDEFIEIVKNQSVRRRDDCRNSVAYERTVIWDILKSPSLHP